LVVVVVAALELPIRTAKKPIITHGAILMDIWSQTASTS
jgi:hypothetical protein